MKTFESKFESSDKTPFYVQGWEPDVSPPKAIIALVHGLGELSHRFANWRYAELQPGTRSAHARRDLIRALRSHRPGRKNP